MYERYFGLHERPFDLTPNPRFLLMTAAHREVLGTIQYAIAARKGLTLVLGPPGTGKTTLVHAAIEQQDAKARAVYLGNPTLTRDELYEFLAREFGLGEQAASSKPQFLRELRAHLVERREAGATTALIVDEAQLLSDALLEELRLLENLETPTEKLLPVILVGQSELAARLRQPALLSLKQRVALRTSLSPLTPTEVTNYIAERIRIAGGSVLHVFTPAALAAIADSCGGIPRNISVVCDNALVSGFALDERPVGPGIIAEVCQDFDLPVSRGSASPMQAAYGQPLAPSAEPQAAAPEQAAPARPSPFVEVPQAAAPDIVTTVTLRPVAVRRPQLTNLELSDATESPETLMMEHDVHDDNTPPSRLAALGAPVRFLRSRLRGAR
jgi:type II secretory pathway predicted ATPase ExeA